MSYGIEDKLENPFYYNGSLEEINSISTKYNFKISGLIEMIKVDADNISNLEDLEDEIKFIIEKKEYDGLINCSVPNFEYNDDITNEDKSHYIISGTPVRRIEVKGFQKFLKTIKKKYFY